MKLNLRCFLVGAFFFLGSLGFAQTVPFDQINSYRKAAVRAITLGYNWT